nr:alpha/beta hydrolase [Delftia sp. PS-11]
MIRSQLRVLPTRAAMAASLAFGMLLALPASAGPIADAIKARRAAAQGGGEQEFLEAHSDADARPGMPAGSRVEKDVAYGPDPAQRLDVYLPPQARSAPIVFMVHGGAWMVGDKAMSKVVGNKVAHWLPRGFAFVSINYRMSSSPRVLEQADDVARALAFVQAHAAGWGADPARMVLMGHSAGAHLVSLLTADPVLAAAHGARPWLGTVSLDSAVMDVARTMQERHYRFYDRVFGSDPAYWASVSPFARLRPIPAIPMMLVCSSRRDDACPQARAFAARVHGMGGRAAVLPVDLSHGEVNGELGLDSGYTQSVDAFARSVGMPAISP